MPHAGMCMSSGSRTKSPERLKRAGMSTTHFKLKLHIQIHLVVILLRKTRRLISTGGSCVNKVVKLMDPKNR